MSWVPSINQKAKSMLTGPTFLIDLAGAAKPKAEQLERASRNDNSHSESIYQESTPSLFKHAIWSPNNDANSKFKCRLHFAISVGSVTICRICLSDLLVSYW